MLSLTLYRYVLDNPLPYTLEDVSVKQGIQQFLQSYGSTAKDPALDIFMYACISMKTQNKLRELVRKVSTCLMTLYHTILYTYVFPTILATPLIIS